MKSRTLADLIEYVELDDEFYTETNSNLKNLMLMFIFLLSN